MFKPLLTVVLLTCLWGPSWAQTEQAHADRAAKLRQAKDKTAQEDPQKRRAALRAALIAQRDQKPGAPEEPAKARRQLSPQERQELRQQLRQQRSDGQHS